MGKMRVGAGAFRGRRRSQGAKGAAIDRASPTDGWAAPVQRGMRAGLAMSDGPASARIQANVGSLLAALRLPAAIAQPVAYRARRRASRKAWYLSTVACVAALCTVAAQAAGQGTLIYVPNADDNTASVIDSATNATVATIPIGDGTFPLSVAVSGDQSRVWMATEIGVFAINTATNSVTQWTTVEPGDEVPKSVAVTPDGRTLYVSYDSGVVPIGHAYRGDRHDHPNGWVGQHRHRARRQDRLCQQPGHRHRHPRRFGVGRGQNPNRGRGCRLCGLRPFDLARRQDGGCLERPQSRRPRLCLFHRHGDR